MKLSFLANEQLVAALTADGVDVSRYGPAYDGESVGLDLYNAGPDLNAWPLGSEFEKIAPWESTNNDTRKLLAKKLMPTGLKVIIPPGYVGFIKERGSITKTPLIVRAGVIDPGYLGQIFVNMVNGSSTMTTIKAGAKSPFQLVVVKAEYEYEQVDEATFNELAQSASRADGMIGSSDNK